MIKGKTRALTVSLRRGSGGVRDRGTRGNTRGRGRGEDALGDSELLLEETRIRAIARAPR